jgi:lipoprotein NlpI
MRAALMLLLVTVLGTSATVAGQTLSENLARCNNKGVDPDLKIAGCTAAIQSGQLNDTNLSFAFNNRGFAYGAKNDYDRAIQDLTEAIRLNPSDATAFNNRGADYRHKQDYDRAIQDYTEAIRLNPSYAPAFFNRGYIYFYLGKFAAAQSDFAMGLAASPTVAYGVLWLYLATSRADQSAHAGLEANAAKVKLTDWPGPVIQMYLGKMTTAQLLSAASDPDAEKDRGQHCEAYFYLGEQALIAGRRTEAKRLFQQSIDTGVTSFVEYAGAQSELKRLQATPATGSH